MSKVVVKLIPAVFAKDFARLVGTSNLADDHQCSPLIDRGRIVMGLILGNVHGEKRTEERAAGSPQSGSANATENGANTGQ